MVEEMMEDQAAFPVAEESKTKAPKSQSDVRNPRQNVKRWTDLDQPKTPSPTLCP